MTHFPDERGNPAHCHPSPLVFQVTEGLPPLDGPPTPVSSHGGSTTPPSLKMQDGGVSRPPQPLSPVFQVTEELPFLPHYPSLQDREFSVLEILPSPYLIY